MLELLARLLPLMLAAAANPVVITMVVLLLTAPDRPLLRAWSFLAGFALVLVVGGVLFLALFHNADTFGPGGNLYAWIDIGFGALMLGAAVMTIRRGSGGDGASRLVNRIGPLACAGLGAVMMLTNTSAIAAYVPLLHEISNSDLPRADHWVALAISDLVILAPIAAPALISMIAPDRAGAVLGAIRRFLDRHGPQIAGIVFFALGAFLVIRGIGRL